MRAGKSVNPYKTKWIPTFAGMTSLLFLLMNPTHAANCPNAVTLTLGGGHNFFSSHSKNANIADVALAYNFDQQWAVEGFYGALDRDRGNLYLLAALYRFCPCGILEPYLTAGIGISTWTPTGENTHHQGNINAGIGTQLFLDKSIALRAEVRDIYATTRAGNNTVMVNFGVSFLFG